MANYKQTDLFGEKYNRVNIVRFNNHYNSIPSVDFNEEEVFVLADGNVIKHDIGILHEEYSETKTFNLINPLTGELGLETMTHKELFTILHGLYLTLGIERDK